MPRIFASLHPFFESGPINGRKMANAGFMRTLLTLDPFDEYHFFVGDPASLRQAWKALPVPPKALQRKAVKAFSRGDLPARLKDSPYHVFHFSDPITGFAPLMAARNRWAAELFPITAVNHTLSYMDYAAPLSGHVWEGCTRRDAIGCNSTAARAVLQQWYAHARHAYTLGEHCPQPQLHVIPMGVPEEDHASATEKAEGRRLVRQTLHISDDTVLLLLFGRIALDDKLDPQPLLMALRRVGESHPHLRCHLVLAGQMGEGSQTPDFLRAVAKLWNIPLSICPNPSLPEKQNLFAAADIFLSPSDNIQETFGLTLVEAARAALPVIASHWDGYRDIVLHGKTGLLIPTLAPEHTPDLDMFGAVLFDNQHHYLRAQSTAVQVPALAEAIALLAGDAPLRRRMGEAAKLHAAQHFTYERVVKTWIELWEGLRSTELSPEEEARARKAAHPHLLPFGQAFAPFASASLTGDTVLQCTVMGEALRRKKLPWQSLGLAVPGISEEAILPLLVLARKGCTVAELTARTCGNSPHSPHAPHAPETRGTRGTRGTLDTPYSPRAQDEELLLRRLLWALKHDLLECQSTSPPRENTPS